ncbi:MAG: phosphoribosylglycinamide formyltransferase [Candidatus Aquicultor secundus]|uniref:phosphoribosylglycinamide formyltransferase n=1 Tax=Candidatus Aquicultor secundus TaxID=1973895 RepID=UPI0009111911|nr:phosphoribosylglycinamide formyltransferase [Candidatus Aquicultor secundus]NCO65511.1 phosphoribosylglycinamide formyltransferase [Solirubrobacter sp.]OIO83942.1 MAG: phosphoribosylglycinamide formyltransferase [Candidatus Aquicultor secundus]PIU26296.1 MAG: phosphoribosylglycinamide formyltransferase [Candidatus Aquicultor secundus]PIW22352.1 MAG: phosphoribosylglycinamide formyltransferase [Candidatus Aquicultor secundus]PIX51487.1 MAG: phosphoribosylglycinamide formyltransferase [Candid
MSNRKTRLGVLISGSGSNLQSIIDKCESGYLPAEVAVVISNKADAYGLTRAANHGIPGVVLVRKDYPDEFFYNMAILNALKEHDVELVVMAGYMRLLGPEVLDAYPNQVLNLHPALLPSFPGAHGIKDALDYGVKVTGVTVHFANEIFDEGPIILQEAVSIAEDDTENTLAQKIHTVEHVLYPRAIKLYCEDALAIEGKKVRIKE